MADAFEICREHLLDNSIKADCEEALTVKHEVEETTDVKPCIFHDSSDSLHCVDQASSERSICNNCLLHHIKQEPLDELSSSSPSDIHLHPAEDVFTSTTAQITRPCFVILRHLNLTSCMKTDTYSRTSHSLNCDIRTVKTSVDNDSVLQDVRRDNRLDNLSDNESTSDTSDDKADVPTDEQRQVLQELVSRKRSAVRDKYVIDGRYKCPQCKKTLGRYQSFKHHLLSKHLNERLHQCTQCEKSFCNKSKLNYHVKYTHGDQMYQCDKCDFSTKYNQCLKQHVQSEHLAVKRHECPHCNCNCSQKSSLSRNTRAVHNHEKPYTCSTCDLRFTHHRDLKVHVQSVDSDEKSFMCDQCSYKCSSKANLKRHQVVVHDKVKFSWCRN